LEHQTDFIAFYEELGLQPGCTIEELKAAYRRRVWALHPDRPAGSTVDGDDARLQHLTAAYSAVTRFHRRHGRMPGSAAPTPRGPLPRREPLARPVAIVAPRPRRWPWLAAAAAAVAIVVLATQAGSDDPVARDAGTPAEVVVFARGVSPPAAAHAPSRIELGTGMDDVRTLEGSPVMESGQRWDYGPSWIEFADGKVSDWYSSRLRPLKVASTRPASAR